MNEDVPAEVLKRALWHFGPQDSVPEILRDPDRGLLCISRLFWYAKSEISRGSAWDQVSANSDALGVKREAKYWGWRKCHTKDYWCWYAYDLVEEETVPQEISGEVTGE